VYIAALLALTQVTAPSSPCDAGAGLRPSRDLYCIELFPANGVSGPRGVVGLLQVPGPFTISVTAGGTPRLRPVIDLSDLPAPSSFGAYSTYVAWATTPVLDTIIKLGEVRNGRTLLREVALDRYLIIVSAERSGAVKERTGRLVLRGESASNRMRPPDILDFALGTGTGEAAEHHHEPDSLGWTMVPMPPGVPMPPIEHAMRPSVHAYLPADDPSLPLARPREVRTLKDGDTLQLEAGMVRRSLAGRSYTMFGFNGQYPGPLLVVKQAARVTVVFRNRLDQPSTIHWHGIRLDNRFDGVPDMTQDPVAPGGSFTYQLKFPDAGIYWYHPHVREDLQQDLGLYGNILVRSPRPDAWSPAHREEILMLDDLLVGDDGQLVPWGKEAPTHALMGRFGNVFLANGEPAWRGTARPGEVIRYYFTNASNTRTFNLSFPGARMKVIGSDLGTYTRESWVESVVMGPAERYVVQVQFNRPGRVALVNRIRPIDHMFGRYFSETDTLGIVTVGGAPASPIKGFTTLRADTVTAREIREAGAGLDALPEHELVLTMQATLPYYADRLMRKDSVFFNPVEWSGTMPGMNWSSSSRNVRWFLRDPATGKEDMAIDWHFKVGDRVRLRLGNDRTVFHGMQHPVHLHGQRFYVLAVNGVPNDNPVWKDTVLLPAGGTVDLLLELTNPGRWMLHCHIAEHLEAGMMMAFEVSP
jgi:FtsP/CotA-like multicopper oxidase with cupredoxin domain